MYNYIIKTTILIYIIKTHCVSVLIIILRSVFCKHPRLNTMRKRGEQSSKSSVLERDDFRLIKNKRELLAVREVHFSFVAVIHPHKCTRMTLHEFAARQQ